MFHTAKCPSCAGELDLSNENGVIKCSYCGSTVITNETRPAASIKKSGERSNFKIILTALILLCGAAGIYYYLNNRAAVPAQNSSKGTITTVPIVREIISADRGNSAFISKTPALLSGLYDNKDKDGSISGDWYNSPDGIKKTRIRITPWGESFEVAGENLNENGSEQWMGYGQLCNEEMFVVYYYTNLPETAYITLDLKKTNELYANSYEFNGKLRWSGKFSRKEALTRAGSAEGFSAASPGLKPGIYNDAAYEKKISGDWYHRPEGVSRVKINITRKGESFEIFSDNLTNQWKGYGQLRDNIMCVMYYYTNLAELCYITFEFGADGRMSARSMGGDGKVRWSGVFER